MPPKYAIKTYRSEQYYHVFNRGNNKDLIFFENSDYSIFRNIARNCLETYAAQIDLIAFALMPNHYHFLVYQRSERAITHMMRSLNTRYAVFINKRHSRVGRLFQGRYRARIVEPHKVPEVTQYILENPLELDFETWPHVGKEI